MKPSKVLLIYKKSAYAIYHHKIKQTRPFRKNSVVSSKIQRIIAAHNEHYETLQFVENTLQELKIAYAKRLRKRITDFSPYSLVLTVGGDGTFLETARFVKKQYILGVNSSPGYSVGKLCRANRNNFRKMISKFIQDEIEPVFLQRLSVKFPDSQSTCDSLNEVLICDKNPALMSRYYLSLKDIQEEQYGSGLWVSTPSGSTGAIKSAGGKVMKLDEKRLQYLPRELYKAFDKKYQLKGGMIDEKDILSIVSFMKNGMIYVDGNHYCLPFGYGKKITIGLSKNPVKTFKTIR